MYFESGRGTQELLASTVVLKRVISTIASIRIPFRVLMTLLITYLLSSPTPQAEHSRAGGSPASFSGLLHRARALLAQDGGAVQRPQAYQGLTWTPKVCRKIAFLWVLGHYFAYFWGFRYALTGRIMPGL